MKRWWRELVREWNKMWEPPTDFETELRRITATEAQRADARNGALEMVKLGLTSDQLGKMASRYYLLEALGLTRRDLILAAKAKITPEGWAGVEAMRESLR